MDHEESNTGQQWKKIVRKNIKYQNIMNIMNITPKPFQTPRSFKPVSLTHQTLIH